MSGASPMVMARDVTKVFGSFKALNSVSMSIAPGSVQCIIGPSGSGKSTFLRCINQLEKIDRGAMWVDRPRSQRRHAS
jgi:polar amino acid transport system ATP-binding protein